MDWGLRLSKKKKVSWVPAFISLCCLTSRWLATSCFYRQAFPIMMDCVPSNSEPKSSLPSLRCFCQVFCHGNDKNNLQTHSQKPPVESKSQGLSAARGRPDGPCQGLHGQIPQQVLCFLWLYSLLISRCFLAGLIPNIFQIQEHCSTALLSLGSLKEKGSPYFWGEWREQGTGRKAKKKKSPSTWPPWSRKQHTHTQHMFRGK